ncbi:hypothetical protein N9O61_00105 [Octadecabacter sp.]|nr:hypothetical protein [Octadecabacter sp.]
MVERVTIVAASGNEEPLALRALLESMAMEVRLLRVLNAADMPATLLRAAEDNVVILSACGSARGFGLGHKDEMSWVDAAEAFKGVVFLNDAVLISTAGAARESGLVDVMFKAGGHLIAPNGNPDRRVIVPWVGACLLRAEAGLIEAVRTANTLVETENRFSYG